MTRSFSGRIFLVLLVLLFAVFLAVGKNTIQLNRQGDAAIFEQLIENIHAGRGAVSNVFSNTQNYIDHGYFSLSPQDLMDAALRDGLKPPAQSERNMLGFHAYYILFPISSLLTGMSSSFALTLLQILSYCALMGCTWEYTKKKSNSALAAFLFVVLVLVNPNWFIGIQGQFYPDRLFIVLGFILLWQLRAGASIPRLLVTCALIAMTNERAALIGGFIMGLHVFLFFSPKRDLRRQLILLGIAIILLIYSFVIKNYFLSNVNYDHFLPQNLNQLISQLHRPIFVNNIVVNVQNNAFLLLLGMFAPRYLLIAVLVMLPNMIGDIGGAEKVGWATHYHSYYFPPLVFAGASGLINLIAWVKDGSKRIFFIFFGAFVIAAFFLQQYRDLSKSAVRPLALFPQYYAPVKALVRGEPTGFDIRSDFVKDFRKGSTVATNEFGMAMIHQNNLITVFPLQLREADYVFVNCDQFDKKLSDTEHYHGTTVQEMLIGEYGFDPASFKRSIYGFCSMGKKSRDTIGYNSVSLPNLH